MRLGNCFMVCAGLVVAVLGSGQSGTFVVEDWCTAGMPKQVRAPDMEVRAGHGRRRSIALLLHGTGFYVAISTCLRYTQPPCPICWHRPVSSDSLVVLSPAVGEPHVLVIQDDSFVLMVSGLRLGEGSDFLPLQMLVDYIGGHLGGGRGSGGMWCPG